MGYGRVVTSQRLATEIATVRQAQQDLATRVTELREDFRGLQTRLNALIGAALVGPIAALLLAHLMHF